MNLRWCAVAAAGVVSITGCSGSHHDTPPPVSLSVTPAALDFQALLPGQTAAQTVRIANTGGTATQMDVSVGGTDAALFPFSNHCPVSLAGGAQCEITVSFIANGAGVRSAALSVRYGGFESHVALSATLDPVRIWIARLQAYLHDTTPVAPYSAIATSLAHDVDSSATQIDVADAGAFPQAEPFIIELRNGGWMEYALVTDHAADNTLPVIRGYAGTAPLGFAAGTTTITWRPVVLQRGAVINGEPLGEISATFISPVGGTSSGQLAAPLPNGVHRMTFADGEARDVTVRGGVNASWSPTLAAGVISTAESRLVRYPPGIAGTDPLQLLAARFDSTAPVYIAQSARLARRGAVLTGPLPSTGADSLNVDSTADFSRAGDFLAHVAGEDLRVRVTGNSTLAIVERGVNGTAPAQIADASLNLYQVLDVDNRGGGTQAHLLAGGLNSGLHYLGVAPTLGPLLEYLPEQPLCLSFELQGASFELLAGSSIGALLLVDGVIQHPPNLLVESNFAGNYWHRFDFGSRKTRHITLLMYAYPMAIAHEAGDAIRPWDRATEPVISMDGDSFGQTEGYVWSDQPNGGGLGIFLETMLQLGFTQFDHLSPVGGTGYSAEGAPALPDFPRPRYSGVNRVATIAAGPAPLLFIGALGHNDNYIDRTRFATDTRAYWAALRSAWPTTIFVATQFYFPAAGSAAPEAFLPNPLSTPNDAIIEQALASAGGPWIYINTNQGSWVNSSGARGGFGVAGQPLLTGTGYGGAPGYRGGHATGVGNGDLMIRDDGVHPSNIGARYLGTQLAAAIRAAAQAL